MTRRVFGGELHEDPSAHAADPLRIIRPLDGGQPPEQLTVAIQEHRVAHRALRREVRVQRLRLYAHRPGDSDASPSARTFVHAVSRISRRIASCLRWRRSRRTLPSHRSPVPAFAWLPLSSENNALTISD